LKILSVAYQVGEAPDTHNLSLVLEIPNPNLSTDPSIFRKYHIDDPRKEASIRLGIKLYFINSNITGGPSPRAHWLSRELELAPLLRSYVLLSTPLTVIYSMVKAWARQMGLLTDSWEEHVETNTLTSRCLLILIIHFLQRHTPDTIDRAELPVLHDVDFCAKTDVLRGADYKLKGTGSEEMGSRETDV
jgi:hypothetical protein